MPSPRATYAFQPADRPPDFDGQADAEGPGFARVSVGGELDLATAPKLGEALAAVPNGTAVVILDLRELTFMDSTGLHLILNATVRLAEAGCRLVLIPGGPQIQRIFEITGTRQHVEFVAAPSARQPAIVGSRSAEFLSARFCLWLNANDVAVGASDPSVLPPSERRTHSSLDPSRSHPDGSRSPPEGQARGNRRARAGVLR